MNQERLARVIARFILIACDIGLVWFLAFACKPNITSGTVWFIALLFAAVQSNIYWTVKDNAK